MIMILSPNIQSIEINTDSIFYNSLLGNPRLLNNDGVKFINLFKNDIDLSQIRKYCEGNYASVLKELRDIKFIINKNYSERDYIEKKKNNFLHRFKKGETLEHISLSVSELCNFNCQHCLFFQREKSNTKKNNLNQKRLMSWEIAKLCIDKYLGILTKNNKTKARIHFGNAEPLLNWPIIKKSLIYCSNFSEYNFEYAINTNLSLLTDDMALLLKKHNVQIATSLDGIGSANNIIRTSKNINDTYTQIVKKIEKLEKLSYPLYGISVTVTDKNFDLINESVINFAIEHKMKSIAFDYDLINGTTIEIDKKIKKILFLKEHAEKNDIYFDGTWGIPFRRLINKSLLKNTYSFCSAMEGKGITFHCNGDIALCDYSKNVFGNVNTIENIFNPKSEFYKTLANRFPGSFTFCKGCVIEGFCSGQCYITQEVSDRRKTNTYSEMCNFYIELTQVLLKRHFLTN